MEVDTFYLTTLSVEMKPVIGRKLKCPYAITEFFAFYFNRIKERRLRTPQARIFDDKLFFSLAAQIKLVRNYYTR